MKESHPFYECSLEILKKMLQSNFECIKLASLQSICSNNLKEPEFRTKIFPLVKNFLNDISWRIRLVIVMNIENLLCKTNGNNFDTLLAAFADYMVDNENEVIIYSLKILPRVLEFCS